MRNETGTRAGRFAVIAFVGLVVVFGGAGCDGDSGGDVADAALDESDARTNADGDAVRDAAGAPDALPAAPDGSEADAVPDVPLEPYGFALHLEEAIALNEERRELYAAMTADATRSLSDFLLTVEDGLVATARDLDERAAAFQAEGIPIVAADFVSMDTVLPYDTPAPRRGALTAAVEADVTAALAPLKTVDLGDLAAVSDAVHTALVELARLEETHDIHLAMSKHLLESAGLAAHHGLDYAERTGGRTYELSVELVRFQLELPLAIDLGLMVDKRANPFHREGVGIIVNDVPPIPFVEEYESASRVR